MSDKYRTLLHEIKKKFMSDRDFLPLHEPIFLGNEKEYLNECIDSGFVSSVGEFVNRFESDLAAYTGAKYAVATVNGTAALHIALLLAGVERGDEVLTQSITFIATANAISYTGAKPVFIDVERNSLSLSPDALLDFLKQQTYRGKDGCLYNKKTGSRIRACLPVHIFGLIGDTEKLAELCTEYGITLIEDAAEALGSFRNGKSSGTIGKIGTFSFNGNKIVTAGGGGAIVTNDTEIAAMAKHLTTTAKVNHPWKYEHDSLGFNYRMPNINAALICAQLEQIDKFLESKQRLFDFYAELFQVLQIEYLKGDKNSKSNNWLIAMVMESEQERDEFLQLANNSGVMTRPLWTLMNELKMYENCQVLNQPNAEYYSKRVVNLPSSANLI